MLSKREKIRMGVAMVLGIWVGVSATFIAFTLRERHDLDAKLHDRMLLTATECARLDDSQRARYAMRNPMKPDVPCVPARHS